jgi:ABC transporter substrate binding protein
MKSAADGAALIHVNVYSHLKDVEEAARKLGREIPALRASTVNDVIAAFADVSRRGIGALYVDDDGFFNNNSAVLATLAVQHRIAASFSEREYAVGGGLMSYGAKAADVRRQLGVYAGRILKGEKPGDLPIVQPTKFEFVLNLKTARARTGRAADAARSHRRGDRIARRLGADSCFGSFSAIELRDWPDGTCFDIGRIAKPASDCRKCRGSSAPTRGRCSRETGRRGGRP